MTGAFLYARFSVYFDKTLFLVYYYKWTALPPYIPNMKTKVLLLTGAIGLGLLLFVAFINGNKEKHQPLATVATLAAPPSPDLPKRPPPGFLQLSDSTESRLLDPNEVNFLLKDDELRTVFTNNGAKLGNLFICTHNNMAFLVTADHVANDYKEKEGVDWHRCLGGTEVAASVLGKRSEMIPVNFEVMFPAQSFRDGDTATIYGLNINPVEKAMDQVSISGVARLVKDPKPLAAFFAQHAPKTAICKRLNTTAPAAPIIEMEVTEAEYERLPIMSGSFLWQERFPTGVFVAARRDASNPHAVKHYAIIEPLTTALEQVKE